MRRSLLIAALLAATASPVFAQDADQTAPEIAQDVDRTAAARAERRAERQAERAANPEAVMQDPRAGRRNWDIGQRAPREDRGPRDDGAPREDRAQFRAERQAQRQAEEARQAQQAAPVAPPVFQQPMMPQQRTEQRTEQQVERRAEREGGGWRAQQRDWSGEARQRDRRVLQGQVPQVDGTVQRQGRDLREVMREARRAQNVQRLDGQRFDDQRQAQRDGRRLEGRPFDERRFGDRRDDGQRFGDPRFGGQRGFERFDQRYERGLVWGQRGQAWSRDWRRDRRFDWQRHRFDNRDLFASQRYYAPYGWSYGYRRFSVGFSLSSVLFDQRYWIDDPYAYRLPDAHDPYRWVRYYDDVLLVDLRNGRVVDVIYDFFDR